MCGSNNNDSLQCIVRAKSPPMEVTKVNMRSKLQHDMDKDGVFTETLQNLDLRVGHVLHPYGFIFVVKCTWATGGLVI